MKIAFTTALILLLGLWIYNLLILTGIEPLPQPALERLASAPVAALNPHLALPKSTAELGDSLNIAASLFSAVALVLALIAVFFQGKELRAATQEQTEQTKALLAQSQQQIDSNQLQSLTASLQFLSQDADRRDKEIERLVHELKTDKKWEHPSEAKTKKWGLVENMRANERDIRNVQIPEHDNKVKSIIQALDSLSQQPSSGTKPTP